MPPFLCNTAISVTIARVTLGVPDLPEFQQFDFPSFTGKYGNSCTHITVYPYLTPIHQRTIAEFFTWILQRYKVTLLGYRLCILFSYPSPVLNWTVGVMVPLRKAKVSDKANGPFNCQLIQWTAVHPVYIRHACI